METPLKRPASRTKRPASRTKRSAKSTKRSAKSTKRSTKKGWVKRHILAIVIGIMSVIAVVATIFYVGVGYYDGDEVWVYIPKYATEKQISDSLELHLGDATAKRVMMFYRMMGADPHNAYGAYKISHGDATLNISRRLKSRMQTPVKVTFTGARTMDQIYKKVTENIQLSPNDFKNACLLELPELGYKTEAEFPAAFIPDTYEVYWAIDGRELVKMLLKESNKFWTKSRKARAAELGLTPVEVATLASIVEEESAKVDERPKIARLYINRLKKGMKLQADPTVKYALGDFALRRITQAHLTVNSPYNTYQIKGLPPGPIRVPERSTLKAVLEAPEHDYLYMCAREDFSGYHNFAKDYATHQANAARYQAELNRRNIH